MLKNSVTLEMLVKEEFLKVGDRLFFVWKKEYIPVTVALKNEKHQFLNEDYDVYATHPHSVMVQIIKKIDADSVSEAKLLSWSNMFIHDQEMKPEKSPRTLKLNFVTSKISYVFSSQKTINLSKFSR